MKIQTVEILVKNISSLPKILTPRTTSAGELRSGLINGKLIRLLPGTYTDSHCTEFPKAYIAAALSKRKPDEVISHSSAATLWGFPDFRQGLQVHVSRPQRSNTKRTGITVHRQSLSDSDVFRALEVPVTSLEKTALNYASALPSASALAALDFAVRSGVPVGDLIAAAKRFSGRHSKRVLELAHVAIPNSDSPPESMTRYWAYQAGLHSVVAQYWVSTQGSNYYLDCAVPEIKLAIEYDGLGKYDSKHVIFKEKIREDRIRAAGWTFIRVTASDLRNPALLVARLRTTAALLGYVFEPK